MCTLQEIFEQLRNRLTPSNDNQAVEAVSRQLFTDIKAELARMKDRHEPPPLLFVHSERGRSYRYKPGGLLEPGKENIDLLVVSILNSSNAAKQSSLFNNDLELNYNLCLSQKEYMEKPKMRTGTYNGLYTSITKRPDVFGYANYQDMPTTDGGTLEDGSDRLRLLP